MNSATATRLRQRRLIWRRARNAEQPIRAKEPGWRGAAGRGCSPGSDRGCYHVARADVAVGAGLMAREQVGNRVGRQRAREEEALPGVAPRLAELVELSGLLDALRDDREVEVVA